MAKKGITLVVLTVVLFLFMGTGLFAQDLGPRLIRSPEKEATATQFWSDPDNFISVTGYNSVEFDKWFGVVSFYPFGASRYNAQLGFAANFGPVYAALLYGGNMWALGTHSYTEREQPFFGSPKNMKTYNTLNSINSDSLIYNEVSLLIGAADMGFRLSFDSDYHSRKLNEDFGMGTTTITYYKSFIDKKGHINPQLAWGMARSLLPNGLQPHVYLDIDFGRDYRLYEQYNAPGDIDKEIGRSENSLSFGITAASGAYSVFNRGGFDLSLDLWYVFDITAYNNEYNYIDEGDPTAVNRIKAGYKGRFDGTGSFMEESNNNHAVIPCVYAFWEGEKISLAAELDLGLGFGFEKNIGLDYKRVPVAGNMIQDGSGTLVKDGEDAKISYIQFNPVLMLGLKWAIVPEKFFLNAGGTIDFGYPQLSTTKGVSYSQGQKINNSDFTKKDHNYQAANTTLSLGVTFYPTVNLGFQAVCGVDINNDLSTFDPTGLFYFSKILATVKF